MWILCQNASNSYMRLVMWGFVLIFLVLGFFIIVMWLRRKTLGSTTQTQNSGFLLSDLRKMRDEGKLSAEEYEKAKAVIVGSAKRNSGDKPPDSPKKGDGK